MKCLYCGKDVEEVWLSCPICGNGMCIECYNNLQGTDEQCFDIDESIEDEELHQKLKEAANGNTQLICYSCIEKFKKEKK